MTNLTFMGYRRADGRVGVRNHVLILPTVVCANQVAEAIGGLIAGTVAITHQHGCVQMGSDLEQTTRTLVGMAANPNVYGTVVVGLGCEAVLAGVVSESLTAMGKPVRSLNIQDAGGTLDAIAVGARLAMELVQEASTQQKVPCDLSGIVLGTECGGSDACSGISANPVLGHVSDELVKKGGTVILAETTELIGAEHILARRAADDATRKALLKAIDDMETQARKAGVDMRGSQPTPGNIAGGLTTIEEKSLGCVHKAGTSALEQVVAYAVTPSKRGLVMMDTPGQDIEQLTGMVAGGANVVVFTTGRGTPTGSPIAPVIRMSSNTPLYSRMKDNIDIDAGGIVDGTDTIASVGDRLFAEMLQVCSGKLTKAEMLKHREFGIYRIGPTI